MDKLHLQKTTSDRGFGRLPAIPSEYGGEVRVYESSSAMGPHIWLSATAPVNLNEPNGPTHEVPIHLTAENAWRLSEQIQHLVRDHYQGDASPVANLGAIREAAAVDLHAAMLAHGEAIDLGERAREQMGDELYERHRQAWREYVDVVVRRYAPVFEELARLRAEKGEQR